MLSHMVLFRDATLPRQSQEPVHSTNVFEPIPSTGTHAMPLQPPPMPTTDAEATPPSAQGNR